MMNCFKIPFIVVKLSILLIACNFSPPQPPDSSDWSSFSTDFEKGYKKLPIPELQLAYVKNLKAIKDKPSILQQEQYFQAVQDSLTVINADQLSAMINWTMN